MTWFDKGFLACYFLLVIIVQSKWQAVRFGRNLPVNKRLHEVYYCLTILPVLYFFWPHWWQVITISVMERFAFFDFILNKLRRKPLFYNGKGSTDSIMDIIENHLSSWAVKVLKVVYVIVFVLTLIFIK